MKNLQHVLILARKHVYCLKQSIAENPPITVKEGGVIQDGFDEKLDTYRDASRNGKEWLAQLEQQERERTGIKNLKIGYNRVFGYFIEITKSNIHLADLERYERKQTLANAERYITPELKEKEDLILNAEAEGLELEYDLFTAGSRRHENAYTTSSTTCLRT